MENKYFFNSYYLCLKFCALFCVSVVEKRVKFFNSLEEKGEINLNSFAKINILIFVIQG